MTIQFMRIFFTCLLTIIYSLAVKAQALPRKIADQPDGITIYYFDSKSDTCLPRLFIGDTLNILFPCYSKANYTRKDISKATKEIKRLRELLTSEFIVNINQCCSRERCPDTIKGYYLRIKNRNSEEDQFLDISYASPDKCGSEELSEIIDLLNKISKQYQ